MATKSLIGGWLAPVGQTASTPIPGGAGGLKSLFPAWLGKVGANAAVSTPSITSVSVLRNGNSGTISGSSFGGSQGSVFLGGVGQTITSWATTSITFDISRSGLRYPGPYTLTVQPPASPTASTIVTLLPQLNWNYVNVTEVLPANQRMTTVLDDLAVGDQIAWQENIGAENVIVDGAGAFDVSAGVTSFSSEAHDGLSWGTPGVQSFGDVTNNYTSFNVSGTWRTLDHPEIRLNGAWTTPLSGWVRHEGSWRKVYPLENQAPIARMTLPGNGDSVSGTRTLRAYAIDDEGVLLTPQFKVSGNSQVLTFPATLVAPNTYEATINWTPLQPLLTYEIWFEVSDTVFTSVSPSIYVTVLDTNTAPTVNLTSSASDGFVTGNFSITATYADLENNVADLKLYRNGSLISTIATAAPSGQYTWSVDSTLLTNGSYRYVVVATDNAFVPAATTSSELFIFVNNLVAPVLTSQGTTATTGSTASSVTANVSTNQASGTLFVVLSANPNTPTAAQIAAGRDATGNLAPRSFNTPASYIGSYGWSNNNLSPSTTYYVYWVQRNVQSAFSNIVAQAVATPAAPSVTVNNTSLFGYGASLSNPVYATTDRVSISVANMTPPLTYSWIYSSGTSASLSGVLSGGQSVQFTRQINVADWQTEVRQGVYFCQVTDSTGRQGNSPSVTVATEHFKQGTGLEP